MVTTKQFFTDNFPSSEQIAKDLQESTSPLEYLMYKGKYENCKECPDHANNLNFVVKTEVESELRKTLKDKEIQDISISKKYINILVGAELFVFNRVGRLVLHKGLKRKKGYGALENTIYGDVLVLNSDFKIIEKYSKQLEYLTEYDFSNDFKAVALDMTVYDSYGYVAICSNTKGIYYGLGVQVDDLKFFRRKNNDSIDSQRTKTEPYFVSRIEL